MREIKLTLNQVAVTVYEASEPNVPVRPRWPLNIAFSAMLGLMLGVGGTLLREVFQDTVKTPADVTRALAFRTLGRAALPRSLDGELVAEQVAGSSPSDARRARRS